MKKFAFCLILITGVISAQTRSNRPEFAKQFLDAFVHQAEARGIEVNERLKRIDRLMFYETGEHWHEHENGVCRIHINTVGKNEFELERTVYHEIGHHLGLEDCRKCTYSIMTWHTTGKIAYLYDDSAIRQLYLDLFFEAIRNPKKYNDGHTHY